MYGSAGSLLPQGQADSLQCGVEPGKTLLVCNSFIIPEVWGTLCSLRFNEFASAVLLQVLLLECA